MSYISTEGWREDNIARQAAWEAAGGTTPTKVPSGWKIGDRVVNGRAVRRTDWRTGSADTPEKREMQKRMDEMEARRVGRPDLFVGDRPEMVARREAAERQRLEMEGGSGGDTTGGIPTTYLLVGGAALVGLFLYKRMKK